MAIKYGFFNSVNGDRKYNAEDIGKYLHGIVSSGVYPDSMTTLQVLAGDGMQVQVQAGRAMLDYHYMENDSTLVLTLANGGAQDRIDAIVARLDLSNRLCEIAVKEGTPAAEPVAPTMTRTDVKKEYMLASVYVTKLVTAITQEDITDTRANIDVCGWVTGLINQDIIGVPVPAKKFALHIPTVNADGTGYELLPCDPTLSFAGSPADSAAVGAALATKAPAGYGLGDVATYVEDLNNAVACGWYFGINAANSPLGNLVLVEVFSHVLTSWVVQKIYYIDANNEWHTQCVRYNKNGGWTEWEYINPPMIPGVEYRTTERWNGKPVYTRMDGVGLLPNNSHKVWTHGIGANQILRYSGTSDAGAAIPYYYDGHEINLECDPTQVILTTNFDATGLGVYYVQLWYTKS